MILIGWNSTNVIFNPPFQTLAQLTFVAMTPYFNLDAIKAGIGDGGGGGIGEGLFGAMAGGGGGQSNGGGGFKYNDDTGMISFDKIEKGPNFLIN
jgi:hypothetical protein